MKIPGITPEENKRLKIPLINRRDFNIRDISCLEALQIALILINSNYEGFADKLLNIKIKKSHTTYNDIHQLILTLFEPFSLDKDITLKQLEQLFKEHEHDDTLPSYFLEKGGTKS